MSPSEEEPVSWLYLSVDDVLDIHDRSLLVDGGAPGIRDRGAVELAVERPRAGFGDTEFYPTAATKAAALFYGLCKNHGFVDGNKRTALGALLSFLAVNQWRLDIVDPQELLDFVLQTADGSLSEADVVDWLQARLEST